MAVFAKDVSVKRAPTICPLSKSDKSFIFRFFHTDCHSSQSLTRAQRSVSKRKKKNIQCRQLEFFQCNQHKFYSLISYWFHYFVNTLYNFLRHQGRKVNQAKKKQQ
jgi:hypothetical protein